MRIRDCHIRRAGLSGIKIISVDGAVIEDVQVRDITMEDASGTIFVRLGAKLRT